MNKSKNGKSKPLRDFLRLASAHDLLGRAGIFMMRKSVRATLWTIGITSSGLLAKQLGLPGFTPAEAIAAPIIVGGGMFTTGAALAYIPMTLSKRLTAIAEANDLNLMEDYRKSQLIEQLNVLWDNVFFHESALLYPSAERQNERSRILADKDEIAGRIGQWNRSLLGRLGVKSSSDVDDLARAVMAERPVSNDVEKSREGFLISSSYGLTHALAQSTQAAQIGYRLNLLEDFRDGAYFDSSDVKLVEQYIGNSTISDIKSDVCAGRLASLGQIPTAFKRDFWFFLITRKIAISTGKAVRTLNEKYGTDMFNAQVLLWPGEEYAGWLGRFDHAAIELLKQRCAIMTGALGPDYETAVNVLDRMLLPSFEFATQLRRDFDPEYCDGTLNHTAEDTGRPVVSDLVSDLKRFDYRPADIQRAGVFADRTRREGARLMEHMKSHEFEGVLTDKAALRAVRIAMHIDKNGLKEALMRCKEPLDNTSINAEIESAARTHLLYSNRLVALRQYHQLTIIQIEGYRELAKRLAYGGVKSDSA